MLASSGQGLPLAVIRSAGREPRSVLCVSCVQRPSQRSGVSHRLHCSARHSGLGLQTNSLIPLQSSRRCHSLVVQAQKGQPDPPDAPREERRGGREWLQTLLSRFGPITQKAENTAVLDFEKPLVELDNRIKEVTSLCLRHWESLLQNRARVLTCRGIQVRKVAEENGVDVSESIKELEDRAKQVTFCSKHQKIS